MEQATAWRQADPKREKATQERHRRKRGVKPFQPAVSKGERLARGRKAQRDVGFSAQYEWMRKNPHKRAAMAAVSWALKTGKLVREPCLFCGAEKVEAHHHSYALMDRLNVTWLCRRHHRLAHRSIRQPVSE